MSGAGRNEWRWKEGFGVGRSKERNKEGAAQEGGSNAGRSGWRWKEGLV